MTGICSNRLHLKFSDGRQGDTTGIWSTVLDNPRHYLGDMTVRMPDRGLVFERVTCFYCLKTVTFVVDCVKCVSISIIKTG